jgi:succinate dehydrogenase/fumarate reductase flavoprotein subunit
MTAVVLAALGLRKWGIMNKNYDVVVVGSGAAGLTTAVVAAQHGLKVLVVEKSRYFGGTTAYSLGAPWIIGNLHQPALGIEDDLVKGERYLRATLGPLYSPDKVSAYLTSGAEMVAYMEAKTAVRWVGVPMPDYFPDTDGASFGRTLLTQAFDGSVLGSSLNLVRPPLAAFSVLGGMQIDPFEAPRLLSAFKSASNFIYSAKKTLTHLGQRLTFGRGKFMANGNALVGRLLFSAINAKVELWNEAQATALITGSSGVTGVQVNHAGTSVPIYASRGVVLASGGFGANTAMRAQFIPMASGHVSVQPDENVGDGIRMGQEAGGHMGPINPENGVWAPVSLLKQKGRVIAKYPHFGPDRAKPGSIIVNTAGERFANESAPYQTFVNAMHRRQIESAYFIANHDFARRYGMGFAFPSPYPIGPLIRNGYLTKASTLPELAAKLGIDSVKFQQTIDVFNENALRGEDPQFGRGANAYDRFLGDMAHTPNPSLAPVQSGPFYAVALFPGDVSTVLGLETDSDARVLGTDGRPVTGLFATGLDQNTLMRGVYPGGGSGIGPGMTFGYRAALSLARGSQV